MLQLTATNNSTGQKIIQRLTDNGIRFIKHIPFNPAIVTQLKQQVENLGIEVTFNEETQWVRIRKKEEVDPKLVEAGKGAAKDLKDGVVTPRIILEREAELLKRAGFECKIEEIE